MGNVAFGGWAPAAGRGSRGFLKDGCSSKQLSMFPIASQQPTELRRKIHGGSGYQIPMPL